MIDVPSLEKIGRKELQALAKEHGIKANQKSAVLRHELRAVLLQNIADEAQEENADAESTSMLAEESNGEQVNSDHDGSTRATGIMSFEDTPAEGSPTKSEIITDDGIELCSPDKASEENGHNEHVIQPNDENVTDATADDIPVVAGSNSEEVNVDERKDRSPAKVREEPATSIVQVEDTPIEESSTSSEMANITAHNKTEVARPANVSKDNVHSDTINNANEENVPDATADSMLANSEGMHVDEHEKTDYSPTKPREKHVYNDIIVNANEEHSVDVTAESTAADNPGIDDNEEVNVCEREIPDSSSIEPRDEQVCEELVHNGISINAIEERSADATAERMVADNPGSTTNEEVNAKEREIPERSPTESREEHATSAMWLEDTLAEEKAPTGSKVASIITDDRIELSSPDHTSEENVHNVTIINANEENLLDATADDMLPSSDSEEVNGDQDCLCTEQKEEHATFVILIEDTPAEKSPSGSKAADVSDNDRIEFSSPGKASEENAHNGIIINAHEENFADVTVEDMFAEKLHFVDAIAERSVAYKPESDDSVEVNVDEQEIADRSPTKPREEHATSVMRLEDKSAEESPTSREIVHVSDNNRIEFSSPGKASEENAHIVIIIHDNKENIRNATTEDIMAEKPGAESGEVNVDEQEIEDCSPTEPREEPATGAVQEEEDTPAEESRTSSEKANVSDDTIEVSSFGAASAENVHNKTVQIEDNMSATEPAVSSIEKANTDDQEMDIPVNEEEQDKYSEIFQSEHQLDEKSSDDAVRSRSVEVEVSHDESACTLTIDSFTRTGDTEHALVDKAGIDNEKEVAQDESSKKTSETLAEKEVAADEESEEGHSVDGGSANDTNCSRTATLGQHEHSPVDKKLNSSAHVCKMASKDCQKRPLSKGEQMSFGYIRKTLPSISTITSFQASTHKGDAKMAKSLPPVCQNTAQDLSQRPTSSGNKKVLAVKECKPRVPLQTLSNQKDKPKPFSANSKRPVHASMSERNEKQLKKFLDRQAAAREKRATEAVPAEFHRK